MRTAAVWLGVTPLAIGSFGYLEPSNRAAYFAGYIIAAGLLFGSVVIADALAGRDGSNRQT